MTKQRTDRLNSLLKEVLSEVIRKDVQNRDIPDLITVTAVEITKDLRHAKVFISLIGTEAEKVKAIDTLQELSGFIGTLASKKVVMRYFPVLKFILDDTVEKQMRIEELLKEIDDEKQTRDTGDSPS